MDDDRVGRDEVKAGDGVTQVVAVRLRNGLEDAIAQQSGSGRKVAVLLLVVLVLLAHCRIGEWIQRTGVGENLAWFRNGRIAVKRLPVGLGAGQGQGAPL